MGRAAPILVGLLMVAVLLPPAVAQADDDATERLDIDDVRAAKERVEVDASLDEDLRLRVLELYDVAIGSLESAEGFREEAVRHAREKAGVARLVDALRAELARPMPAPRLDLPASATGEQAEDALARERARLAAHRTALRSVERLSEERAATRNEISRRLGALDQELETLADELRTLGQLEAAPAYKDAARLRVQALQERALAESGALRASLSLLDARGALLPWKSDQAQRRVDHSENRVRLLQAKAQELGRLEAESSLQQVRTQCRETAERSPELAGLAAETEEFAEALWGPEGIITRSENAARELSLTRKSTSDLNRIVQLTRRKFDAFGSHGSITRWWPEVPEDFPTTADVASSLRRLEREIPEVEHQLIRLEHLRSGSRKLLDTTLAELAEGGSDPEAERLARELFNTRREIVGRLIQLYGRHSSQLVELETVKRNFLTEVHGVTDFLYERLLWVRSVPRPIVPRPADLGEALGWLTAPSNWGEVFRAAWRSFRERTGSVVAALLVFGLLLGLRRRFRRRLRGAAEIVREPDNDSFTPTLGALLFTLLLAAPLPIALTIGGRLVLRPDAPSFAHAAGSALLYLAAIAGLFELSRQFLVRDGLAEAHFGWPPAAAIPIRRVLLPSEAVFLPLIYVAILFGMQGMGLDSPERYLGYNNSLGRVAFVVALTFLGFTLLGVFRPRARKADVEAGTPASRLHRVYVFAYPAILVATLLPAGLAVLGYYLTGYLLAYQLLRTLWLLGILLILHGVMVRWRIASRRRARVGATGAVAAGLDGAELQTRQMNRFLITLIAAVGLYAIWSDAVPALEALKRVQVWPRIEVHESADVEFRAPKARSGETAAPAEGETGGSPKPAIPLPSVPDAGEASGTPSGVPGVTLWAVLQSLLAVVITVALVKNLPGVLELGLRRRTRLDAGARIALGTLTRYTILILGFSTAFGLLGISWSKIQWLAAALTFGLGFGLQEIVANFVSGLILLVERPIRVGDAVTVGNLQGIVSRIQIRATTIALWDRSEMIVPNKEFITTKLVNWTLTDSRRRIDIPVRVAYGADLEKIKETLVEVAREHPNVFDDPAPHVLLIEFGDDAMRFELRFFVEFGEGLTTRDQVQMAIDRAFRERGIEFAIPKLDLRLPRRTGSPNASRREEPPSEPTD